MARESTLSEDLTRQQILDQPDDTDTEQPEAQPPIEQPVSRSAPSWMDNPVVTPGGLTYTEPAPQPETGGGEIPRAQPVVTGPAQLPDSTDQIQVTHYGYSGDSRWDENSGRGVGDSDNSLIPNFSVALTRSGRQALLGVDSDKSTGQTFQYGGRTYRDDDTAPEGNARLDVYDPVYQGLDEGVTKEMADARRRLAPAPAYDVRAQPIANLEGTGDTTGVPNYFSKRGDDPITSEDDPRLTTVSVGGQDWQVNREAAPYFQGFLSDLKAAGAPIRSDGGWNYRNVAGTDVLSQHAYGGAIDVSSEGRNQVTPEFRRWLENNPGTLETLENKWHIYGGERFGDLSHFEWGGVVGGGGAPSQKTLLAQQPAQAQAPKVASWLEGNPVVSGEQSRSQIAQAQQQDTQSVAQLAQATQNEQSVPGLIRKLDDPNAFPGVPAHIRQQYKNSLQNQLTAEAQQFYNEPDQQKAFDKAMGNADAWTPVGETMRLFQAYVNKSVNAWNASAQTGEENTINQFINLINPNATPQQKIDFYHDLTDPSRSTEDRTHHVMALYSQIDPQVSATIPPQNLLDAVDHQSDPAFVKQRQDFLKNEADQIAQRTELDPRLKGTFAGAAAENVARAAEAIAGFGAGGVVGDILRGSVMTSELLQDTKDKVQRENPGMSAEEVNKLAGTSTLAQLAPQAILMLATGGFGGLSGLAKGLGIAVPEIANPVLRIGSRALVNAGIGAGAMTTQQIAGNLAEGRPVMEGVTPQSVLTGAAMGLTGALHGEAPEPRPEPAAPEPARPPQLPEGLARPEPAAAPEIPSPPAPRELLEQPAPKEAPLPEQPAPREAPAPVPTPEGETPAPTPTPIPEVKPEGEEPRSAIANRYIQEQIESGELNEIAPGQGFSTEDLIRRGENMGEEERNQHISDVMNDKGGNPVLQGAAVRAEEQRLRVQSRQLSSIAENKPNDIQARIDADNAHADLMDFINGPVAKIKQNWHGLGMAMQGEHTLDLSTINGLREQWLQDVGKPTTPNVEQAMRKTVDQVREVNGRAAKSMDDLSKAIENDKRKMPTIDEVADFVMNEMGVIPCPRV